MDPDKTLYTCSPQSRTPTRSTASKTTSSAAMLISAIGFYKYVYFISLGYGFSIAGLGLLIYMAGNGLFSLLVTLFFPDFANINDAAIMEMVQSNYGLMVVGTVLLVPIAEECFYRGLIFRNLYGKHPVMAYILSMVIFSLAHVAGYVLLEDFGTLALCFVQYIPAGLILAGAYDFSGSIFAPILIHTSINLIGILSMR